MYLGKWYFMDLDYILIALLFVIAYYQWRRANSLENCIYDLREQIRHLSVERWV